MYPSSLRMRAISVFNLETGTSTRWCFAAVALRSRVKKSAIGSVCIVLLPAGFHDSRDLSLERHAAETDAAHLEFADVAARAAAATAAVAHAHLELGLLQRLGDFCGACHLLCGSFFAQGKTQPLEQFAALFIVAGRGRQRNVHALDLVHARVVNLRKHQLVLQPQGVIAAAIEGVRGQSAKSRTRGSTTLHNRSRNSYIFSPRRVTAQPMGMPLRILKFAMDFLARVIMAFCPVICPSSTAAVSSSLTFWLASPRPMLTVILETLGTAMTFFQPKRFISAGTVSLLYFSCNRVFIASRSLKF